MGKVVEIPSDMAARDLCQLLVYKSHCVDDNCWALVEHHPALGLGKDESRTNSDENPYTFSNTFCWDVNTILVSIGVAQDYGHP